MESSNRISHHKKGGVTLRSKRYSDKTDSELFDSLEELFRMLESRKKKIELAQKIGIDAFLSGFLIFGSDLEEAE